MRLTQTLTTTQGYTLTDTHKAVRLDADTLVTHTAVYKWSALRECWMLDKGGLLVDRCKNSLRGTYRWDRKSSTFVHEAN